MKKGFTLIELMILVMVLGVLALALYPSYNSIQTRAQEAKVRANMHTAQLAAEDFSTQSEGIYPQLFNVDVVTTNANVVGNVATVAGVNAAGLVPDPSTAALPVLLPGNFRNPVSKPVGFAFASGAGHVPPAAVPVTICPAVGAALDQGSVYYISADASGAAAAVGNAARYVIYGCGVLSTLPSPLLGKQ